MLENENIGGPLGPLGPRPGTFEWCVRALRLPGDPAFTAVARVACMEWATWPEQLVGRMRAGEAVSDINNPPVATGLVIDPSRLGYAVMTRRVAWHLAYQFTHASAGEIGEVFGGHAADTVAPFLRTAERLEELYPAKNRPIGPRIEEMKEVVKTVMEMEAGGA